MLKFIKRVYVDAEKNVTVAVKVVSKIDHSVDTFAQQILVSIYNHFPLLGHNINGVTYAQMLVALLLFLFILFLRPLFVRIAVWECENLTYD